MENFIVTYKVSGREMLYFSSTNVEAAKTVARYINKREKGVRLRRKK